MFKVVEERMYSSRGEVMLSLSKKKYAEAAAIQAKTYGTSSGESSKLHIAKRIPSNSNSLNHANETNNKSRKCNDGFVKELTIAKKICRREDITVRHISIIVIAKVVAVQDDSDGDRGKAFDDENDNGNAEGIWEAVLEEEEDIMDIDFEKDTNDEMNKLLTSVGDILETYHLDTFITPKVNHIEITMKKENLIATDDVDPLTQTDDDVQPFADIVERKNKRRSRTEEDKGTSNREKLVIKWNMKDWSLMKILWISRGMGICERCSNLDKHGLKSRHQQF